MRRIRTGQRQPNRIFSGVAASATNTMRNAQSPR